MALALVVAGCHSSSSGAHGDAAVEGGGGATGGSDAPVGTGSLDGLGGVDADVTTPEGFCRGFYRIIADLFARCDGFTTSASETLFSDPILCGRFVASISAHRSSFDPTHARACLDEVAAAVTCDGTSSAAPQPGDCAGLAPLVPIGGTCRSFYGIYLPQECQGAAYCKQGPNKSCDGTCTAFAGLNQPCDLLNNVRCAQDLVCDSTSKTCVMPLPAGGAGASCDNKNASCARGLYCDFGADGGATGICHDRKMSGPCLTSIECVNPERCVGPSGAKVCVPPKHPGEACTPGLFECDLLSYCGSGGKCTGTPVAIGAACGLSAGENIPCAPDAYCDAIPGQAGTCRAAKQAGDACTGTILTECAGNGGHCDATTHTCVACPF